MGTLTDPGPLFKQTLINEVKNVRTRIVDKAVEEFRNELEQLAANPESPFVFTNENGDPWSVWAIQSQVRRVRERIGRHDWTLHDIRAKAESDHTEGLGLLPLYRRVQRITPVR